MSSEQGQHVVFLNIKATGHVNPTLPIVAALKSQGCQVTYFVHEDLRVYVEAAGADWRPFRPAELMWKFDEAGIAKYVPAGTPPERYSIRAQTSAREVELQLPALLEDLAALVPKPTVIVADAFVGCGGVAAHVLGVPAITMLTMPGPGSMAKPKAMQDAWESEPWVDGPRRAIIDSYGFDIFKHAMPMEYYSPVLNLVTSIEEFFSPPAPGHQQERFGKFPFRMVGLLAESSVKRITNANVPGVMQQVEEEAVVSAIDQALQMGKQAIFISLGTVATSAYYSKQFGHVGSDNGLMDVTGKELAQHVFRCCFEAFGDREDLLVALSLGPKEDILDGLPPLPANFVARQSLPQLQVLMRCSAFLTHGGADSMHESLGHGVPMVVVPVFGDQPINGDAIARCGAGVNFRSPLESLTSDALRKAMDRLLEPGQGEERCNSYQGAARAMALKLAGVGGSAQTAAAILQATKAWGQQQKAHPRLLGSAERCEKAGNAGRPCVQDVAVSGLSRHDELSV